MRRIAEGNATALIDHLDEARRDGLIYPVLVRGVSNRLAHDLIRETIYDDLPAASRVELHWRIAAILEHIYQPNLAAHVAEIAYHYRESVRIGSPAKATDFSIRAGGSRARRVCIR